MVYLGYLELNCNIQSREYSDLNLGNFYNIISYIDILLVELDLITNVDFNRYARHLILKFRRLNNT